MQKEVRELLELIFEGSNATIQENVVKITTKSINGGQISRLDSLYYEDHVKEIDIKRSGTGMTVLVTTN